MVTNPDIHSLLVRFSTGRITAIEARKHLGDITYGELLRLLANANLRLPSSPTEGREESLSRARAWMFPDHAA